MSAYEIPRLYKEFQLKSALLAEKEKHMTQRRAALKELKTQSEQATTDCTKRQSEIASEAMNLSKARSELAQKKNAQEDDARQQRAKLSGLEQEEGRLIRQTENMHREISHQVEKIHAARTDAAKAESIDESIQQLKEQYDHEQGLLENFEKEVSAELAKTELRHEHYERDLPDHPLPRAELPNANALEQESMVFVD